MAVRSARNSTVHSNGVMNYATTIRLFWTVLRDHLENFSSNNNNVSFLTDQQAFKNLKLFCEGKAGKDDLFDRLNTATLNQHLRDLMDGLTAKVFRTYNASSTLQSQLKELTNRK